MKKMIILLLLFSFPFSFLLAEGNMVEQDMYTLDGDIAKAVIIVYEQYCLSTKTQDSINNFNFIIRTTATEIHIAVVTKELVLGGAARYIINRKNYTITSEEYYS